MDSQSLIKSIKNLIIIPLAKLINRRFDKGIFPDALKTAIVVPIYKKGDKEEISNYRPISLLPILSKVVEKCISRRITHYFESNVLFSNRQFGFREGRSTVLGIQDLLSEIMDAFESRHYHIARFFDLSKAFDCVSHEILINKLKCYGFNRTSIRHTATGVVPREP